MNIYEVSIQFPISKPFDMSIYMWWLCLTWLFVGSSCANNDWHRSHLRQSHVKRQESGTLKKHFEVSLWAAFWRYFICSGAVGRDSPDPIFTAGRGPFSTMVQKIKYEMEEKMKEEKKDTLELKEVVTRWRRRCFEWENIYCVAGQWPPLKYKWKLFTVDTLCLKHYTNHFGASLNVKTSSFEKPFEGHFSTKKP